ncbi:hypothetical protein BJ170DRAFT_205331 [Xylariales sp. AK1849]|nr:hypothetical protein BJ170DRAFT_205331 [Xylariales sp. AK1849]
MMASTPSFVLPWEPESESSACRVSAEQVGHIQNYIAGRINADDCAASLTKPVEVAATQGAEAMEDAVFAIHSFINSSALRNLHYQPQLLSLVLAIQKLPSLEVPTPKIDEDGEPISLGDEGSRLWEDVPGFGHQWGDNLRARQAEFYDNYNSSDTDRAATVGAEWTSAVAWSAQLVSQRDPRIAGDFFLHFASYSISHVLEREHHPMFAQELPAVSMLFRFGAAELLRLCRENNQPEIRYALYDFDDVPTLQSQGRSPLWTGPGGYSLERWAFWKSRWQALSAQSSQDPSVLRHMSAAVGAMEAAEKASSSTHA